jgi:hypothetical protein
VQEFKEERVREREYTMEGRIRGAREGERRKKVKGGECKEGSVREGAYGERGKEEGARRGMQVCEGCKEERARRGMQVCNNCREGKGSSARGSKQVWKESARKKGQGEECKCARIARRWKVKKEGLMKIFPTSLALLMRQAKLLLTI